MHSGDVFKRNPEVQYSSQHMTQFLPRDDYEYTAKGINRVCKR